MDLMETDSENEEEEEVFPKGKLGRTEQRVFTKINVRQVSVCKKDSYLVDETDFVAIE